MTRMNIKFYLRELVTSLMLTFSTFTLAYASTKEQGQYQEDEEEGYKYDDYERIPSSNTRVVKGVYSTNRGNKELEAQLSFSIDYPHGGGPGNARTRHRSGGGSPEGDRRGVPGRKARRDGLLQHAECHLRYRDEKCDQQIYAAG